MTKKEIRQHCLNLLRHLSPHEKQVNSIHVCQHTLGLTAYQQAKHIALYYSTRHEIDLSTLWTDANINNKTIYFPRITNEKTLFFLPVTHETIFLTNKFGIHEPVVDSSQAIDPAQLDIIFLPLVAFDDHGRRLGMGAGYYDRTLSQHRPPLLIGVAHDCQKQTQLPFDPWDVLLDKVITPTKIWVISEMNKE